MLRFRRTVLQGRAGSTEVGHRPTEAMEIGSRSLPMKVRPTRQRQRLFRPSAISGRPSLRWQKLQTRSAIGRTERGETPASGTDCGSRSRSRTALRSMDGRLMSASPEPFVACPAYPAVMNGQLRLPGSTVRHTTGRPNGCPRRAARVQARRVPPAQAAEAFTRPRWDRPPPWRRRPCSRRPGRSCSCCSSVRARGNAPGNADPCATG